MNCDNMADVAQRAVFMPPVHHRKLRKIGVEVDIRHGHTMLCQLLDRIRHVGHMVQHHSGMKLFRRLVLLVKGPWRIFAG